MIQATDLRINNIVGCKVSNDSGIYQIEGIDGWKRIFKSEADKKIYYKNKLSLSLKEKPVEFHDERLVRLTGGARNGELYIESQLKGIKLTEEWLLKLGFVEHEDEEFYSEEEVLFGININHSLPNLKTKINMHIWDSAFTHAQCEFVHQLQNLFFALTAKELQQKQK